MILINLVSLNSLIFLWFTLIDQFWRFFILSVFFWTWSYFLLILEGVSIHDSLFLSLRNQFTPKNPSKCLEIIHAQTLFVRIFCLFLCFLARFFSLRWSTKTKTNTTDTQNKDIHDSCICVVVTKHMCKYTFVSLPITDQRINDSFIFHWALSLSHIWKRKCTFLIVQTVFTDRNRPYSLDYSNKHATHVVFGQLSNEQI